MEVAGTVHIQDVQVVSGSDRALCCCIKGRNYWISRDRLLAGSTVAGFADHGIVVLGQRSAQDLGLAGVRRPALR